MQVVKAPDPRLRVQTRPVKKITPALIQTTKDMIKLTLTFKDPEGVGLASTQVGLDGRFFISLDPTTDKKKKPKFITVFNPKILSSSKKTEGKFEGCLSVPNYWGEVIRHSSVKVSYQNETGKTVVKTITGLLAHIFQHEIDHLNGIIFTDRVLEQKGRFYKFTGKDETGTDTYEEITI